MLGKPLRIGVVLALLAGACGDRTTPPTCVHSSVAEIAAAIRVGTYTSEACVQALLGRIARHRELGAFIAVDPRRVLSQARAADRSLAAGDRIGPLHGVPIAVKDNIDTQALPTSGGTDVLRELRPARDASILDPLWAAGAILLGKVNLHELAQGPTGQNATFGVMRNPHDPRYFAGGSGGGGAAAVAGRLAPASIESDAAGSIRRPASFTGIVGFRPDRMRYPHDGVLPLSATMSALGLMARSVGDVILLDQVITGAPIEETRGAGLSGLRIAVPSYTLRGLDSEIASVFADVRARLEARGVRIVELDLGDVGTLSDRMRAIFGYEVVREVPAYLRAHGAPVDLAGLVDALATPNVRSMFRRFLDDPVSEEAYEDALAARADLRARYEAAFVEHDLQLLVQPVTTLMPPRIDASVPDQTTPVMGPLTRNPLLNAAVDLPALAIPAGVSASGLPVGVELAAQRDRVDLLFAVGLSVERLLGAGSSTRTP